MGKFTDSIFNRKYYKAVQASYEEATGKKREAFDVWRTYKAKLLDDSYESKKYIHDFIGDIRTVAKWMGTTQKMMARSKRAVQWLYHEKRGRNEIPAMNYEEYKFVALNTIEISKYDSILSEYRRILRTHKEAVERFLNTTASNHSYEQIKRVSANERSITEITAILNKAHDCERTVPNAWGVFSGGRRFGEIPLHELRTIDKNLFVTKDAFLKFYNRNKTRASLIMGEVAHPVDSFSPDVIGKEKKLLEYVGQTYTPVEAVEFKVHLTDEKELKRAILDSTKYGKDCNFSDSFTISDFYPYRAKFDELNVGFDTAVSKLKSNEKAICSYNKSHGHEATTYIEDYWKCVDPNDPLYDYIETYKNREVKRNQARSISNANPKGFKALFGTVDFDTCSWDTIMNVINVEPRIREKEAEIREIERQEAERQQRIARQQRIESLRSSIRYGFRPSYFSLDCFALYNYYPTTCSFEATEDEWDIRRLIWDFKANPHRAESLSVTRAKHQEASDKIVPLMKKCLERFYGSSLSELTLACVPSSKKEITERRYKEFSDKLCTQTSMGNGYSHVNIIRDGLSKNDPANTTGVSTQPEISVDGWYFKDKLVILFDDVITSGSSMERFKNLIERNGGTVIGGFSIGRTRHNREYPNPIDKL